MKNIEIIIVFLGTFIGILNNSNAQDFEPSTSTFTLNSQVIKLSPDDEMMF